MPTSESGPRDDPVRLDEGVRGAQDDCDAHGVGDEVVVVHPVPFAGGSVRFRLAAGIAQGDGRASPADLGIAADLIEVFGLAMLICSSFWSSVIASIRRMQTENVE
jgi:hypothetical protein